MDLSVVPYSDREAVTTIIERCMIDRMFYIEEVLGVTAKIRFLNGNELDEVTWTQRDTFDRDGIEYEVLREGVEPWQREVIVALDGGETKISIRSAVGVGKTTLVSWLGSHFLCFRDDVKIIVTSPSFNQLQDGIIPEVKKWIARMPAWLKDQLETTTERVTRKPDTANNFISFRTARKETPEALQGIHATHVLLLVDEASGVHESVYEAGQGTLSTAGAIAVLIGNPTRTSGLFYQTHRKLKKLWRCWKITSFMSSRVDASFPEQMKSTYGPTSMQYKVRVLGEFPEGNADSVIPRQWVESAIGRDIVPSGRDVKVWGVDPGRGGDPTGFCEVVGKGVTDLAEWHNPNLMQVVGKIKVKWDALPPSARPAVIMVDVIGLGGGVVDRLEELDLPVVGVNVAEMSAMKERYVRLRAELWNNAREFFETKNCWVSESIDEELLEKFVEELSETAFKDHSSGRMDVESKKDLKARSVASPNLADAFNLTTAEEAAVMNGSVSGGGWDKPLDYKNVSVV